MFTADRAEAQTATGAIAVNPADMVPRNALLGVFRSERALFLHAVTHVVRSRTSRAEEKPFTRKLHRILRVASSCLRKVIPPRIPSSSRCIYFTRTRGSIVYRIAQRIDSPIVYITLTDIINAQKRLNFYAAKFRRKPPQKKAKRKQN